MFNYSIYGSILVISGPSGSGKSTLLKKLLKNHSNISFSISTTTRSIRDGEIDGKDYNFISIQEFENGIKNDDFIEWANVHGNYYGTSKKTIQKSLQTPHKIVVLDIDVQGFIELNRHYKPYLTSIFLTSPNKSTLENRLRLRGTDTDETIDQRLKNALIEMNQYDKYDYIIINNDIIESYSHLEAIIDGIDLKTSLFDKTNLLNEWSK